MAIGWEEIALNCYLEKMLNFCFGGRCAKPMKDDSAIVSDSFHLGYVS